MPNFEFVDCQAVCQSLYEAANIIRTFKTFQTIARNSAVSDLAKLNNFRIHNCKSGF